ncbi:hypothetical protein ACFL43_02405 [Thermodesulfobacteriota bacterium]
MFCPQCRAEYRQGFSSCADCNVALVHELPPEPETQYVDLAPVLSTHEQGDIALVKSILQGEGIPFVAQGDYFSTLRAPIEVRFLVPRAKLEQAREALRELL